jgi:hypothetical protein
MSKKIVSDLQKRGYKAERLESGGTTRTNMPRFFMVAPFEHLMARTKLCQAPQSKCAFVLSVVGNKATWVRCLFRREFELHASKHERSRRVGREGADCFVIANEERGLACRRCSDHGLQTTLLHHLGRDGFTLKLNCFGKF